jgi:hypothetical protein
MSQCLGICMDQQGLPGRESWQAPHTGCTQRGMALTPRTVWRAVREQMPQDRAPPAPSGKAADAANAGADGGSGRTHNRRSARQLMIRATRLTTTV